LVVACVRQVEGRQATHEVQRFATTTRGLLELRAWLESQGCTHVAMEATGAYWKPVWHVLEDGFELVLANAAHIRNVPGRKSDVNDAVWISDILAHGLIRASFVPPRPIQELRDLTRTRKQLVREIAQHTQRLQRVLEDANVKLSSVVSNVIGLSGRRIVRALIEGRRMPSGSPSWDTRACAARERSSRRHCAARSASITASCFASTCARSSAVSAPGWDLAGRGHPDADDGWALRRLPDEIRNTILEHERSGTARVTIGRLARGPRAAAA
ncbi:MAG: IS110 family transposase, partial [Deltaproteobacteria bacterium]